MSQKMTNSPPLHGSKHHHHHHHPYIKFTNVQCSATPQGEGAPVTMANRGESQGPDAGPHARSAAFPPLRPFPLPAKLPSRPAQLVLPTLHAQPQTYTTTRMSYGLVSCYKAASMSVGKTSPSLIKWVPGVEVDAASTSTTTGAGPLDKRCTVPAEIFLRRRCRCGSLRVRIAD